MNPNTDELEEDNKIENIEENENYDHLVRTDISQIETNTVFLSN